MSKKHKPVSIIGVPLDHGAGRRGVGMGPSALRIARLHKALERTGRSVLDRGDIDVAIPETLTAGDPHAKYLPLVTSVCTQLSTEVAEVLDSGGFPLVIGGDHSIAMGTISGVARHVRDRHDGRDPRVGVLWFDAHADLNTPETSPTGNIHGMPLAALLGEGPTDLVNIGYKGQKLQARRIVQIGLRDLDDGEKELIRGRGIHAYTMADIDKRGMAAIIEEAAAIVSEDTDFVHVDFDIDVLDPQVAPGTGTRVMGGLTYREAHLGLEMTAARCDVGSFGLVEVNPILDEKNRTAEVAVSLIASAMGARIL